MGHASLGRVWQLKRRSRKESPSGAVGLLFVLRFCARPLAGPPVGRTDSAIAPDLQASANFNSLLKFRRETFCATRCPNKSQPR